MFCELFTFFTIQEERKEGEDVGSRATFEVIPLAEDNEELGQVWQTWLLAFDARKCGCYDINDKERISWVIFVNHDGVFGECPGSTTTFERLELFVRQAVKYFHLI